MFDAVTARLIQNATPLDGLDLAKLPQFLTDAYAQVVAARLGAARLGSGQRDPEWESTILELRRLAETYEGLAIFLPHEQEHRPACAFVAGSAHYTLSQARRLQLAADGREEQMPSLSAHAVAPEVAACLLFLIGGQQADAAETAKNFVRPSDNVIATQLLDSIAALASGDGVYLRDLATARLRNLDPEDDRDYLERAADVLWRRLTRAVQLIARTALGMDSRDADVAITRVIDIIEGAKASITVGDQVSQVRLPVEGSYHLARLLKAAAEVLLRSTVISTPPPDGVEDGPWSSFLTHFAAQRPFLWRNHVAAVQSGFLGSDASFVLTFPTGAGKTTITELRIAAEMLRGRKVVYLAPTRALVDQVSFDVSKTLRPVAADVVRGRFLEDFGERADARVFVQTPEQCLAYLSYEPEGHAGIGLIVVDECHQLSGDPPDPDRQLRQPDRRAVDAMWTLLSLMRRSPAADVVLISAMVSNGEVLATWLKTATRRPASVLDLQWKPTRQVRGVVAYDASEVNALSEVLRERRAKRGPGRDPGTRDSDGLEAVPIGLFCHSQVWDTKSSFAKFPLLPAPAPLALNKFWGLTANRNEVGGRLLAAMAQAGMRPIVFSQRIDWTALIADSAAEQLEGLGRAAVSLTGREQALFAAAAAELGDPVAVDLPLRGRIGVHHGLLLLSERLATEAAFRRSDGLLGLVATPTVAQGINLPAEAVIIAGDDRWAGQGEEGRPETLAVHELLNAAGRAGRAGHYAHGIVVDLPGKVFAVEDGPRGLRFSGLEHVMSLFGLPDQCLEVIDPLTQVLDRIQHAGVDTDVSEYLVRRAGGLDEDVIKQVLGNALGNAFDDHREEKAAVQAALLKAAAADLDEADEDEVDPEQWRELASLTGVSPLVVAAVANLIPASKVVAGWQFRDLRNFATSVLFKHPGMLFGLVDPQSSDLARIMPRRSRRTKDGRIEYTENVDQWEARWRQALEDVLPKWLTGVPLNQIGADLHCHRGARGQVKAIALGRRFALQAASGLAHGVSLVARLFLETRFDDATDVLRTQVPLLAGCVREGFDVPDKLLLFWTLRSDPGMFPRVLVHQRFRAIKDALPSWADVPDIDQRRKLIRSLIEES